MAVTATGISVQPKALLREMLATCPAWLTRLGRDLSADGSDKIYINQWIDDDPAGTQIQVPLMIISTPEGSSIYEYDSGGSQIYLFPKNSGLILEIRDRRRYPENHNDDATDFENFASAIIEYLADKSGQDGMLVITAIAWATTPRTSSPVRVQRQEGEWQCAVALTIGLNG
jgi:hypothetical protein